MFIYGKNSVLEALRADRTVHELLVQDQVDQEILDRAREKGISPAVLSKKVFDKRFGKGHQGVAARVAPYASASLDALLEKPHRKLFVLLDGIEDPQNLGAILRSAEVFGVDGVIFQERRSVSITPAVVKVSAGAVEHLDIAQVTNVNRAIEKMQKNGMFVVGTDVGGDSDIDHVRADMDLCLVFGSEQKGIRPSVRKKCDLLARIPMHGKLNSLNVSVSTGIALYAIRRRQRDA